VLDSCREGNGGVFFDADVSVLNLRTIARALRVSLAAMLGESH
jgi:hypothetical protein